MSQENPSTPPDLKKKRLLSFEKTRYDYCVKMFETEVSRKQNLETKAQFYLTFITAFQAAIYLSLPYLTVLQGFMHNIIVPPLMRVAITVLMIALGAGLLFSLVAVLLAMKIQNYVSDYPQPFSTSLFSPNKAPFKAGDEADLLKSIAQTITIALDKNKRYNDMKARYVRAASYGILFAVIMLTLLVGISVYLQVYVVVPALPKPS